MIAVGNLANTQTAVSFFSELAPTNVQQPAYITDNLGIVLQVGLINGMTRISETHQLVAELSEQVLENASVISEHVILRPRTLVVIYEQPNGFDGKSRALDAWNTAKNLWQYRNPLAVLTTHELYSNLIIEHVSAVHEAPNLGKLSFTINLKQVYFANVTTVVDPSILATSVKLTAPTAKAAGFAEAPQGEADNPTAFQAIGQAGANIISRAFNRAGN
jgi:hypothetical protein